LSEGKGRICVKISVKVYAPCTKHYRWIIRHGIPRRLPLSTQFCGCPPIITNQSYGEHDLSTYQLGQLMLANIFATSPGASAMKDTSGNTHAVAANTATGTVQIVAGASNTAPTGADYALNTPIAGSSGYVAATVSAYSAGSFTLTGNITNSTGGNQNYGEIGVVVTVATYVYLLTHDYANQTSPYTAYLVSNGGTLAVTVTISNA